MPHDLMAVTIGIGDEHARLAQIAAERMRRQTGLEVRVLGADDLVATGLSHPYDLKFRLFDRVNAENLLYFDADIFCLRRWNPREYCGRPEWVAVRGWWFDPWVQRVGAAYGFGEDLFNAGLFLCNRTHHAGLLRLAEALQTDDDRFHGLTNPDEIALNAARAVLQTPLQWLDRRYNWIQYGRGDLASIADVILAHACDAELRAIYATSDARLEECDQPSGRGTVDGDLAGQTFIYDRLGYDLRPLHFRSDGTVGAGQGGAERFYFSTTHSEGRRLVIGSELDETCTLHEDIDGVWRGRWSHHERMPVTLTRHRAQVLINLLREQHGTNRPLTGVEVGVFRGETSAILLRELPRLRLYLVDPWRVAAALLGLTRP